MEQLKIKYKGGGSFVQVPPQFSIDGTSIYIVWNNIVVSYNTRTGKRLREYRGLIDPIVGFSVYFIDNCEHITACSKLGEIITWKVAIAYRVLKTTIPTTDIYMKSFNLITPVEATHNQEARFLLTYSLDKLHEDFVSFGIFKAVTRKLKNLNLKVLNDHHHVAVSSASKGYIAVVQGNELTFLRLWDPKNVFRHRIDKSKRFTCVACHPYEEGVITGDSLGQVILWYNLSSRKPARAVYHWHTLPVNAVSFSSSGSCFYSGADECVLVRWYFDDSYQRDFLPRLPSNIQHITVARDNLFIAVATLDNAVHVLDPQFQSVSLIQHLVLGSEFPTGIVYDFRTKSMVLNGFTGHIQFYSPHDMTLLYNIDVVGQNKLTRERDNNIENTQVVGLALDKSGNWLATVEERVDDKYAFELRLKFWNFNQINQLFQLNTSIELPHEKSISHILFQPNDIENDLKCVTIGKDLKFKIWELVNADTIYRKGNAWTCTKIGFYRNLSCDCLSFSFDGSLIAIGFGRTLTTWIPETCELKCSLVHPTNRLDLTHVEFGIGNQCHLIVATTSESLSVWNLLTLSMVWTVPLEVSLLVANKIHPNMAVFTTDQRVYIFYPEKSEPLHMQKLDNYVETALVAAFVPAKHSLETNLDWCQSSTLFFINPKQELYSLDAEEDSVESLALIENMPQSVFSNLISKNSSRTSVKYVMPVQHLTKHTSQNVFVKQLLDAPLQTMVPMRVTCGSILKSMILEYKSKTANVIT